MIKMTKKRQAIMHVLSMSEKPLNAEEIKGGLSDPSINLSTVYRSLEFFYANHLVIKTIINQTTYYHINNDHHHHYMICTNCNKMIEIDCHIDDLTKSIEQKHHFKIQHHDLTFYGLCDDCAK